MEDQNKRNLVYFEASSMRGLYDSMENWQIDNQKRLLSVSIQPDNGLFCCIALTNPTAVVITDDTGLFPVTVTGGRLHVRAGNMF